MEFARTTIAAGAVKKVPYVSASKKRTVTDGDFHAFLTCSDMVPMAKHMLNPVEILNFFCSGENLMIADAHGAFTPACMASSDAMTTNYLPI
jgi:hypothetical protein